MVQRSARHLHSAQVLAHDCTHWVGEEPRFQNYSLNKYPAAFNPIFRTLLGTQRQRPAPTKDVAHVYHVASQAWLELLTL